MGPRSGLVVGLLVLALVGCDNDQAAEGGHVPATKPSACGAIPTSSGPMTTAAALRLTAPASAPTGSEIGVQVLVVVHSDGQRVVTQASRSSLLVTSDDQVVGRATGSATALPVPLVVTAGAVRPAQVVPDTLQLTGCPTGEGQQRVPLPPGQYAIVAVLGYGQDALNGAPAGASGQFQLVSEPLPITVSEPDQQGG